jgi:EmrB/QacA subfamily drug resistance transporter
MENKNRNSILVVLFIGVLMGALDIAIVGPALPSIRLDFTVSARLLAWIFSIYVLFYLIGTPLMAKLSDIYGRRIIYIMEIALFTTGSLIVGLSHNFTFVLVGRSIQGFGAGGIFPVASAVIGDTFPPEKRGRALGLIGAVWGIAFLVGPILGGLIMTFATWHWLFFINLPIAIIVITLAMRFIPTSHPGYTVAFDWFGMGVLALMLASVSYGINQVDTSSFLISLTSIKVYPFLLSAILLGFILTMVEKRVSNPILPASLFNRRQLGLAYIFSSGAGFGEASLVFIPLLAVVSLGQFGITTKSASWLLMPVVLAMAVGSPMAGRMLDKLGSKAVILAGTSVMAVGMILISQFSGNLILFIISGVLIGLGLSALLGAPIRYIMLSEAQASERSVAQGVLSVFTSVGQLVGSMLMGAAASSIAGQGAATGYSVGFLIVGFVMIVMVGLAILLKNHSAELATINQNSPS